jgi:hypothetical protein
MEFVVWAGIGAALGTLVAGRPIVLFFLIGVLIIDVRPAWRVAGALVAMIGGAFSTQLPQVTADVVRVAGAGVQAALPELAGPTLVAGVSVLLLRFLDFVVVASDGGGRRPSRSG